MTDRIQNIITTLDLQPHPEGGWFRETYRSDRVLSQACLGSGFGGDRNGCTDIYFLLTSANFSAFHRIRQDELWHFHQGDGLIVHMIAPDGTCFRLALGNDLANGQVPQGVVPAGHWFASEVAVEDGFALVSCTVAPGFDFADFELARRDALASAFPQHQELIRRMTR
ncbi:MAG: cupin domain-containing protein [Flavobacteriales bacterium]|nr:cupin domain-containing protein [Flavobacteriales bacterium]